MVRSSFNNSSSNHTGINVYSRRRNRVSVTNVYSTPAPLLSVHRSVFREISTTRPPFSRRVDSNAVAYTRRRIHRIGDIASTSTSIPMPVSQQLEDSNASSGLEDVGNSLSVNGIEDEEPIRVQPPEAPVMSSPEGDGSANTPLIFLTDTTVLYCPICSDPLSPPLYQCGEGHIVCHSCSHEMQQTYDLCCYCGLQSGLFRCRGLERVLESITASCRYRPQGCQARFSFDAKRTHEKGCYYQLCSCPDDECSFTGKYKELYAHVASHHSTFAKKFVFSSPITVSMERRNELIWLQEREHKTMFILYNSAGKLGNGFTLICVAPSSSRRAFKFDLSAGDGKSSVILRSHAENSTEMLPEHLGQTFLHVPSCFATALGVYTVELTICKPE